MICEKYLNINFWDEYKIKHRETFKDSFQMFKKFKYKKNLRIQCHNSRMNKL